MTRTDITVASDDWFRRKTWTAGDQEQFFSRLDRSRARAKKAQYVRMQALHLVDAGEFSAALGLLDLLLRELPERMEVSIAHYARARCFAALSRPDEAVTEYRLSLQAEREFPHVGTSAWLEFPWFIVSQRRTELYDEALNVLDEFQCEVTLGVPMCRFRDATVRAIIADEKGDPAAARGFARIALDEAAREYSGDARHPKVGLVGDIESNLRQRLIELSGRP